MNLQKYSDVFAKEEGRFIEEWKDLLRIKSISTDKAFKPECDRAAQFLSSHLSRLGLHSEVIATQGMPVVFAEKKVSPTAPTVLFYGHYDVQPVDPVTAWTTDPFEPSLRDGRLYARGAQDNKGQLFYFVKALETVMKDGSLSMNVKVLIEGEEECGSGSITKALPSIASRLSADYLLVCDTGTPDESVGCLTMGLRGIAHIEVKLFGPNKDLHSGVHGGLVRNPAEVMSRIVTSLRDDVGRITIPGFYDGIIEIDAQDRELATKFAFTDEWYRAQVGVPATGGEAGIPPMIRRGLRPTIEVNGIYGGYLGEGSKTIIPSSATLKLSARLVAGQDPNRVLTLILDHLKSQTPPEMRLEIVHGAASGSALLVSSKAPIVARAAETLRAITSKDPLYLWEGASIPLIPGLVEASGATPLLVGFGLEEDNIHAPNESFPIEQFRKGFLFCASFLSA